MNIEDMKSASDIFEFVRNHLRAQGQKSIDATGKCKYRYETSDGAVLKCSAGALIPDDDYKKEMEGKKWKTLVADFGFPKKYMTLVAELQYVHDFEPVESWEERLSEIEDYLDKYEMYSLRSCTYI